MGRTICVWLFACMALASAIPVPGPSSHQSLLDMILNANPENNDIFDIQPANLQTLLSDLEVEKQDPTETDIPKPQDPIPHGTEERELPQYEELLEIPEAQQVQDQEVSEPEIQIEPEPISVPEEAQIQTKPEDDNILVPESEDLQTEPEEVIPLLEEQPAQTEPEEVQIVPVAEEEQIPFEPEEEQIISISGDEIFPMYEDEEVRPVNEEEPAILVIEEDQIIPVYEEESLIEPYEVQIIPLHEDELEFEPESEDTMYNFGNEEQMPIVGEPDNFSEVIIVDLEEPGFNQPMSDEPMIPGFVQEVIQSDDVMPFEIEEIVGEPDNFPEVIIVGLEEPEFNQPISDEPSFVQEEIQLGAVLPFAEIEDSSEEDSQEEIVGEPYNLPEVIIVGLEESEFNQPISEEPSFVQEKIQLDAVIPFAEIEDSAEFDSQEEIPSMHDESQGPAYFTIFDREPSPVEMPVEEMPPVVFIDLSEDQVPNPEILSSDVDAPIVPVSDDQWFTGPVLPITPTEHEEDYSRLVDYYIPKSDLSVEDTWYENPETAFLADDEDHLHEIDDLISEYPAPEEENARFPYPLVPLVPRPIIFPEDIRPLAPLPIFREDITDVLDSETIMEDDFQDEEGQMPVMIHEDSPRPADLEETIFMIDEHDFSDSGEEPTLEIIQIGSLPQYPHDSFPSEGMFINEPIVPIAEFPLRDITPIMVEQDTYWVPENPDQERIIFPEYSSPKHNLPVFPYQWREENSFQPPRNDNAHSHDLNRHFQAPSHDLPPQYPPMMEEPQTMFDMPNDDMSPKMPDFMHFTEESDLPREDMLPLFDIDSVNMDRDRPTGHLHSPSEFYQNSRFTGFPQRFNNPKPFDLRYLADTIFQQDFHGPNTFPLNYPSFLNENLNLHKQRIVPESPVTPNDFRRELLNLPSIPSTMSSTPNMFFPMRNEPENPHEQNMNMNLQVFRISPRPVNYERFNPGQQQFDFQVAFVPYENDYNFQPYAQYGSGHHDFNYPYTQHTDDFNTYQESSSYSVPPYGMPNSYPNGGLYPSSPFPDRYGMNYGYKGQNDQYHPYNYPTPTW